MTRAELFAAFRARTADTATPYLWSDQELQEFLDDGHNEAADRGRLIRDSITATVCAISVVPGTASYRLDSRILSVERAKLDLSTVPLTLSSTPAMDGQAGAFPRDWRVNGIWRPVLGGDWTTQNGTPCVCVLDQESGRWNARLAPIPTVADTLRLQVFRLPLYCLDNDEDEPEIPYRLHIRLVDWMEHRAYAKKDSDTYDERRSLNAEAVFASAFGQRIDANMRRTQENLAPRVTRFREF